MKSLMLIINPGSTSTKVAIYENRKVRIEKTLKHHGEPLLYYPHIIDQKDDRKRLIEAFLAQNNFAIKDIDIFIGRGGILKPLKQSGTYLVTPEMVADLSAAKYGEHASNLGAIISFEFAQQYGKKAYIVDPVCVDEMHDVARVSGLKGIVRQSTFHALNQKAIAKKHAKNIGRKYESLNLIVCHLGGGISVGLHVKGKVIDVNNALGGDGPFSPERTGTIPTYPLVELCFSNGHTEQDIKKMLVGKGGLVSYLHTSDGIEIENRIKNGDQEAAFYFHAMAYRVVKEIGSLYFVTSGQIDDILITGGLAYNEIFINDLRSYIDPIKKIIVYPGENEMLALAEGVLRVLENEEELHIYDPS